MLVLYPNCVLFKCWQKLQFSSQNCSREHILDIFCLLLCTFNKGFSETDQ